ncbi:FHA domain-containing protein [Pseudomonas fluorescens]|uniref:SctD/MshK family protein n=1 Tax=Pseudomonas fluorescens TaxID=294 RepID=UPI0037F708B6
MTALISLPLTPDSQFPVLSIIEGLHQGVALALDKPLYALGSALHCDLVLSDSGIADEHLYLRLTERELAIEARGGDVVVVCAGRAIKVPLGCGHRARLPVEVRVGEACLRLSRAHSQADAAQRSGQRYTLEGMRGLGLGTLMLLLVGSAFAFQSKSMPERAPSTAAVTSSAAPPLTPAQARQWVQQQLNAEGLQAITLTETSDQLFASGALEPRLKSNWTSLMQRFDERFGGQVSLRSNVTQRAPIAAPRVRFQAVWFGPDPYVINDSGKRLYPGAALPDNWVLEHIDSDQVVLARGDEHFKLTL